MDVLREKLLQYLSEQHPPLVEYKELEDWYSEIDTTSCCSSKDSLGVKYHVRMLTVTMETGSTGWSSKGG